MTEKQRTRQHRRTGKPSTLPSEATQEDTPSIERPDLLASAQTRPLMLSSVAAGFPSPAESHIEQRLDLNEYLIQHEAATFFVRAKGDSMVDAGILDNDVLVVDRSLTPRPGCIVVAVVDGEFTVKTLGHDKTGQPCLEPANKHHVPIPIQAGTNVEIWGVVTGSVRRYR